MHYNVEMGSEQSTASHRRRDASLDSPLSPTGPRPCDPLAALSRDSQDLHRHDSVASDVDGSVEVPYVSYTVNRPIGGDSPKKRQPQSSSSSSKFSRFSASSSSTASQRLRESSHNTMVTVSSGERRDGGNSGEGSDDPELARLREIPSFLPIMRASLSGSGAKDPDILERLDFRGLLSMAERYETFLRKNASAVSTQQAELSRSVREVDQQVGQVTQVLADRQKQFAKYQQKLSRVGEISKCLSKCHLLLNENIEQMEVLNNMLPQDERLEPFVWTTG